MKHNFAFYNFEKLKLTEHSNKPNFCIEVLTIFKCYHGFKEAVVSVGVFD